jgi:capsular polysaccharide biosynthesis protein
MVEEAPNPISAPASMAVRKLASVIDDSDRALQEVAGVKHVTRISDGGSYPRRPMAFMDTIHLRPELRENFEYHASIYRQIYSEINATILMDAYVSGQGTVVTRNGFLAEEAALEYLAHNLVPDGFSRDDGGRGFKFTHAPNRVIEEPCILVKRPWYRNYGHWLVDGATILAYFAERIEASGLSVVVGTNESPLQQGIVRETVAKLCPKARIVEMPDDVTWRFSNLLYVTPFHRPPMVKWPEAMAMLKAAFVKSGTKINYGQRLYLSRSDAGTRRLSNEEALADILNRYGFRTVYTTGMSLADQAQLFSSAEVVMGVKGAALTNLLFCDSDATAICLSPGDFIDPFFWDIAGQMGMTYAEVFGQVVTSKPNGHNDFVIEPKRLERALATLLS